MSYLFIYLSISLIVEQFAQSCLLLNLVWETLNLIRLDNICNCFLFLIDLSYMYNSHFFSFPLVQCLHHCRSHIFKSFNFILVLRFITLSSPYFLLSVLNVMNNWHALIRHECSQQRTHIWGWEIQISYFLTDDMCFNQLSYVQAGYNNNSLRLINWDTNEIETTL